MMEFSRLILDIVYFISLYYAVFWLLTFFDEKDVKIKRREISYPNISIIIPMYNEAQNIASTIENVCNIDYDKGKIKLIVVDDGSTDNSHDLAKKAIADMKKKCPLLNTLLLRQENAGKYKAMNYALEHVDTEFFATLDADSYPKSDSLKIILREFSSKNIASVTPILKVYNPMTIIEKIQAIEYSVNHFYKSVLSKANAIHVTPGPLAVYRTEVVKSLGGFRQGHKTEDMELAVRIQKSQYKIVQANDAIVYTKCPRTLKSLFAQRKRWSLGTIRNIMDYKSMMFNKKYGDFGLFQFPMILMSGVLSVSILFLLVFQRRSEIRRSYLSLKAYNFNIIEYIIDSFGTLNFEYWFFNLDLRSTVMFGFFFAVTLYIIHKSINLNKIKLNFEKFKSTVVSFVLYAFFYYVFLSTVWITVFKDFFLRKEVVWKKSA